MKLLDEILYEQKDSDTYDIRKSRDLFVLKLKNDIITSGKLDCGYLVGRMIFENNYNAEPPYCGEFCPLDVYKTHSETKISISKKFSMIYENLKYYADLENFELSEPYIFETVCQTPLYKNEITIPFKTYLLGSSVCCTIEKNNVLYGRAEFVCAVDYRIKLQ